MLSSFKKELSKKEKEKFVSFLIDENEIEYTLGMFAITGCKYNSFAVTINDKSYTIGCIPSEGSHIVKNEPILIESNFVIINHRENKSWFIPHNIAINSSVFPELRQAFYEGEYFKDREADYKYQFEDGSKEIAVPSSNPVDRLDNSIVITGIKYLGGYFPRKWLLETKEGKGLYLRERSGTIKLYEGIHRGDDIIFHAFIGREHPGTNLKDEEIMNIIDSVNYINIVDDYETDVSEELFQKYIEL